MLLATKAAPVKNEDIIHLDRWTKELADDQYAVRENATEQLWRLGASALPRLRELTRSREPEQAVRARELVRKIEMGVYPDSDPKLLSIIARYPDALPSEKGTLIRDLQKRRAWRQMLRLFQEETDETVIKTHLTMMQSIAVFAAREKISQGDNADALELLKLAPKTPQSLLALAHYHRAIGTLDEELHKASDEGEGAAEWIVAMHRAQGEMAKALTYVDAAKDAELAAALAALNGDPLPWLQMRSQMPNGERARKLGHLSRALYASLSINRWNGSPMDASDLSTLKKLLENRSSQYRRVARAALFMLNDHDAAEQSLLRDSPVMKVHYLLMMERVSEALKLLERDVDQPCSEEWVREQIKELGQDAFEDHEGSESAQSLSVMAGFLESRGLHDLAYECFRDPLIELAEDNKKSFLAFMMKLFNDNGGFQPAPRLAIRVSSEWVGNDQERWNLIADSFWTGADDNRELWKLLEKIDPVASCEHRLELVLVLTRRLPGENGERVKWHNIIWNYYQNADGDDKDDVLRLMADLAFNTGDVLLFEKVWPDMPKDMRSDYHWLQQIAHLSAGDKWDEVCKVLLDRVMMMEGRQQDSISPVFHAYVASSLRRAGRIKESLKHERMADLLFLGDHQMAMQIALAYAFGEDYERSKIWWGRAAQSAPATSRSFSVIISQYADSLLFQPSEWNLVACLNEVACCESIDGSYYDLEVPLNSMRLRLKADTFRGLSLLKIDRNMAIDTLDKCHQNYTTDGALADFFFPSLRQAGLIEEHDRWFADSWEVLSSAIKIFPDSINTLNTAAWFASRAQRQVVDAEAYLRRALETYPEQAAYLDTMAEIQFAKGNRQDAVNWSNKAILLAPTDTELRRQHHHFRFDPLPD